MTVRPESIVVVEGDQVNVDLWIAPNVYALFSWNPDESWTMWGWISDGEIFGQSSAIDNPPKVPSSSLSELLTSIAQQALAPEDAEGEDYMIDYLINGLMGKS